MKKYDIAIIGGGIIGFGTALGIQRKNPKLKICIIEKDNVVSNHQTGHNSGVIHSGIYYKPGSLKANFCVEGRASMAEFCQKYNLKYVKCGKIIVAYTEDELPRLQNLYERGIANKVKGLEIIGSERIKEIEPHAVGLKALYAPNTGIVDYREITEKYAQISMENGADVLLSTIKYTAMERPLRFYGIPAMIFLVIGLTFASFSFQFYAEVGRLSTNLTLVSAGTILIGVILAVTAVLLFSLTSIVKEKSR